MQISFFEWGADAARIERVVFSGQAGSLGLPESQKMGGFMS
jgi:hypothetical protein